jgi:glycerol-3-phosphate acyltransferase PlsX
MLSIGEEDAKGNEVTKDAFLRLGRSGLNFLGNVEAGDLFDCKVDVAVCDGFVGNVVLKTSESTAKAFGAWIKEELASKPLYALGALLSRGAFRKIREKVDPAKYGGAPLLGVNGVCIIGHGSSNETAVTNALRVAYESVSHHINPQIIETIARIKALA